jgi:energy-converting hydrogenase Eha subunit B
MVLTLTALPLSEKLSNSNPGQLKKSGIIQLRALAVFILSSPIGGKATPLAVSILRTLPAEPAYSATLGIV